MRKFTMDSFTLDFQSYGLELGSFFDSFDSSIGLYTPSQAFSVSEPTPDLSLQQSVQQSYHGTSFSNNSDGFGTALSSSALFADNIAACCPCASCSSLAEGSAGYEIPSLDVPNGMVSNLSFTLTDTGGVGAGTDAESGFLAAAALWIGFLADAVDVRLDVGFSSLSPGVLGSAGSRTVPISYTDYVNALIADGMSGDDALAIANLQAGPFLNFATNDMSGTYILDNNNSSNNFFLDINASTARALGITNDFNGDLIDDGSADASITFNSDFSWDFDPTDGIGAGLIDFVGVAFHEIGHALGFRSGVDIVDQFHSGFNLNNFRVFTALDVFRYSALSQSTFGEGTLDLAFGGTPFFSLDGGLTNLGGFSTGVVNGDGRQASHWKDNLGLGIMDPTSAPAGSANIVTELDIRAFDAIGWDRVGESTDPVTLYVDAGGEKGTFSSIQDALNAAADSETIVVNNWSYTLNPENVSTSLDDLVIAVLSGVTPTITQTGASATITLQGSGDASIRGNGLANIITGNNGINDIRSGDGDDTIDGRGGDDLIFGQAGIDTIDGGEGADRIIAGDGNDIINGGAGDDLLYGQADDDDISGDDGVDTLIGGSGNDELYGGADNDFLSGQVGDDTMFGGLGDDQIAGQGGADELNGDAGDDILNAGGGNDDVYGGADNDTLNGAAGADLMYGGTGDDVLNGGSQNDELHGDEGADTVNGSAGNDMVYGEAGADTLNGQAGADILYGGADNDMLFGGGGSDDLFGGAGDDVLVGGNGIGNDELWGDSGADTFVQAQGFGLDRIKDFEDGIDLIDFSGNGLANDIGDVLAASVQLGLTVRIELNANNTVIIENFDLADLDATDFIF